MRMGLAGAGAGAWERLGTSGNIWEHLGTSGNIWELREALWLSECKLLQGTGGTGWTGTRD